MVAWLAKSLLSPRPFICLLLFFPHPFFPTPQASAFCLLQQAPVFPGHHVTRKQTVPFYFSCKTQVSTNRAASSPGGARVRQSVLMLKIKCSLCQAKSCAPVAPELSCQWQKWVPVWGKGNEQWYANGFDQPTSVKWEYTGMREEPGSLNTLGSRMEAEKSQKDNGSASSYRAYFKYFSLTSGVSILPIKFSTHLNVNGIVWAKSTCWVSGWRANKMKYITSLFSQSSEAQRVNIKYNAALKRHKAKNPTLQCEQRITFAMERWE